MSPPQVSPPQVQRPTSHLVCTLAALTTEEAEVERDLLVFAHRVETEVTLRVAHLAAEIRIDADNRLFHDLIKSKKSEIVRLNRLYQSNT